MSKLQFTSMLTSVSHHEAWPQTIEEFDCLIEATKDELVHFASYRLGDRDDAEDVVQDVYLEAYRDRAKRKHISGVRSYLFRMVSNRCVDLLRTRSRKSGQPVQEEDASAIDDTFSTVAAREEAQAISQLLDAIPPKEAEVIRLRTFADLSFAEIADAVGSPLPTVKSRFRYGLDRLRQLLVPKEAPHEVSRSYRTND